MDYADKLPPSPWYIFAPPARYIFPPPLTYGLLVPWLKPSTAHFVAFRMPRCNPRAARWQRQHPSLARFSCHCHGLPPIPLHADVEVAVAVDREPLILPDDHGRALGLEDRGARDAVAGLELFPVDGLDRLEAPGTRRVGETRFHRAVRMGGATSTPETHSNKGSVFHAETTPLANLRPNRFEKIHLGKPVKSDG